MMLGKDVGAEEQRGGEESLSPAPVLILGLGNPLLGDDAVGWHVIEKLAPRYENTQDVEVGCHPGGGLSLMERLVGYDRAILIDAIASGKDPTGSVRCFQLEDVSNPAAGHLSSSHDTTLQNALEAGRAMSVHLPRQVQVIAIESQRVSDFTESLSSSVAEAVPRAAQIVEQTLKEWGLSTNSCAAHHRES